MEHERVERLTRRADVLDFAFAVNAAVNNPKGLETRRAALTRELEAVPGETRAEKDAKRRALWEAAQALATRMGPTGAQANTSERDDAHGGA